MAKQTKTAPTAANSVPGSATNPVRGPKLDRGTGDHFARVFVDGKPVQLPVGQKIAPQAQVIVNTLEAAGKKGLVREDLIKNLTGVLVTKQPEGRILSYYQKDLVASGLVIHTKAVQEQVAGPAK